MRARLKRIDLNNIVGSVLISILIVVLIMVAVSIVRCGAQCEIEQAVERFTICIELDDLTREECIILASGD